MRLRSLWINGIQKKTRLRQKPAVGHGNKVSRQTVLKKMKKKEHVPPLFRSFAIASGIKQEDILKVIEIKGIIRSG